jgi:predicted enzyme related to lactoylglutathione lyase
MATVVHWDIAADDVERAKNFYKEMFDWKIMAPPGMADYYLFETAGLDGKAGVGGGIGKKSSPQQGITSYIGVDSIEKYCTKVEKLGGKVLQPKMTVPGWGYMAVCLDTENNVFGLWQDDSTAQ